MRYVVVPVAGVTDVALGAVGAVAVIPFFVAAGAVGGAGAVLAP